MTAIVLEHLRGICMEMENIVSTESENNDQNHDHNDLQDHLANLVSERDELVTEYLFHAY